MSLVRVIFSIDQTEITCILNMSKWMISNAYNGVYML